MHKKKIIIKYGKFNEIGKKNWLAIHSFFIFFFGYMK